MSSPAPIISFPGATFTTNAVPGFGAFPPDCNIAVGPSHVVTIENSRIQWYDRNGVLQSDQSQFAFFGRPNVPSFADARIVFDTVNNRFVMESDAGTQVYIAVSKDSDPNHGWNISTINTGLTINGQQTYSDFPGLATDGRAVYLTSRQKTIGADGQIGSPDDVFLEDHLWIIDAGVGSGGLYDGGPMQVRDFNAATVTNGGSTTIGQPAQILTPTGGAVGTYLVTAASQPGGLLGVTRIDNPTGTPTFTFQSLTGASSLDFLDFARQPGTSATIEAHNAGNSVWRDGFLYTASVIGPVSGPDAGIPTAHWYKIDARNPGSLVIVDQGDVSGTALGFGSGVATFQPSIMVNANGDFVVNFSASGPGLFPGAYYALHAAGDPPGTLQAAMPLHAGEDSYELRNSDGTIRWGDYSGIALDPVDGSTFWIFNQYAALRTAGQAGIWATQIGAIPGASPLVDQAFYFAVYPDVAGSGMSASYHYNVYGWHEGRNPNAYFSTSGYLSANPDVKAAGINPLTHYDQRGWREGRDPGPNFDNEYYLMRAPDVRAANIDPLLHYLQYGRFEGRPTLPAVGSQSIADDAFDREFYLLANPDVGASGLDPHQHYLATGWKEWRDPSAFFSTGGYLLTQPDVAAAGINPLVHYAQDGWREGRDPSAAFDTSYYVLHNPDVVAAGLDPLEHFLRFGILEGRPTLPAVGPPNQITATDFDPAYYRLAYPTIARSVDPQTDFNSVGWQAGRDPNALFDTSYYLSRNPDVAAAGVNPLDHYAQSGWREGRDPSASFSTSGYLAANPDVAAAGVDPLHHFLVSGLYEGRAP